MHVRSALCLILWAVLSGCTLTKATFSRAYGYDNGLLVRAVASVDRAWLIEGRGLILYGEVTPGRWWGDPIRFNPHDDPPTRPFIAALTARELDSKRPRLHYDRFHEAMGNDPNCIEEHLGGKPISLKEPRNVELVDPLHVTLREMELERQYIRIAPLPGIVRVSDVRLGPRGGDWLYYPVIPLALVSDAALYVASPVTRRIWPKTPAVSAPPPGVPAACLELESLLFPPVPELPARVAEE